MKKQLTFEVFIHLLKQVLHFEEEWDIDEWNIQYLNFNDGLNAYSKEYIKKTETDILVKEWAKDFYQEATPNTHDYWVKSNVCKRCKGSLYLN